MKKIIVITGARGIGDLIYQLPLLRSLYSTYKSKLILISNKVNQAKEVYKHESFYSEIIEFDNTRYSILKTLQNIKLFIKLINRYDSDLLILTSNATRLMIPVSLSNAKKKIIFGIKNKFLLKDNSYKHLPNSEKIVLYSKQLNLGNFNNSFFLQSENIEKINEKTMIKKIFLNIDSHHDQNNWKIENFIKIIKLQLNLNVKIFVNFSPNKRYIFKLIPPEIINNKKVFFVYKKTISELIKIINSCNIIIGNESGPICLGSSLKKEVHSIYSPRHTRPESEIINSNTKYYNTEKIDDDEIIKMITKSI